MDPSTPPSIERTERGVPSAAAIYAVEVKSASYVNGLVGVALFFNRVNASANVLMFFPLTTRPLCLYEICTQWNETIPSIGFE